MSDPKYFTKVFEDDVGITAYFKLFETENHVQLMNALIRFDRVRTGGMAEEDVKEAIIDFAKKLSMDI